MKDFINPKFQFVLLHPIFGRWVEALYHTTTLFIPYRNVWPRMVVLAFGILSPNNLAAKNYYTSTSLECLLIILLVAILLLLLFGRVTWAY